MQTDMHFYGTYCIARAAGIKAETAYTIAYSSQFVDDSITDKATIIDQQICIRPIMTSHKPLDFKTSQDMDQWNVWVPFHFLPGNEPDDGPFLQRMICRKNSLMAQKMALNALDEKNSEHWPHLIGITAHVYADTFSHFGFAGFEHVINKIDNNSIQADSRHSTSILKYIWTKTEDFKINFASNFAELIPVGHGAVGAYTDRPYLKWEFSYENNSFEKHNRRDNTENFMEACECLYYFFNEFLKKTPENKDPEGSKTWDSISDVVRFILGVEAPRDQRIKMWKKNLVSEKFCKVTPIDQDLYYDKKLWMPDRAEWESNERKVSIPETNACKFINAARTHRNYILYKLLREAGLLVS